MQWNYRIIKKDWRVGIHKAYYDDDGNIAGWSEEPETVRFEDKDELKIMLEWMQLALDRPVLE